ncbi:MAG: hypothetical protein KDE04_25290, partial [Anaerolineales bacterium]|nr:hypothetical protein [Anaerolineales bacterium]
GQMALGHVNIYWNKEYWRGSDVQIYASNRYQPNAALGGMVSRPITLTFAAPGAVAPGIDTLVLPSQAGTLFADTTIPNAITPGQVRMPASWNRFGEPGLEGADDWARTLAHELGHYLLFLPDNYLLADPANNYLLEVDNNTPCRPSAMASAYANPGDPDSELLVDLNTAGCEKVVAQWLTSLSDWELVTEIYGIQANAPTDAGPFQLPFPVTFVSQLSTQSDSNAPVDELFFVRQANGSAETLSPRTVSAYLFRPGERIIDVIALGAPVGNQINARGARIGDELCVYDMSPDSQRSACSIIGPSNTDLQFNGFGWLPTVTITASEIPDGADLTGIVPVTLDIAVQLFGDESIGPNPSVQVQFFTDFISSTIAYASPDITLVSEGGSRYTGVITLDHAPINSYVRIWVNGDKDSQVMVPIFL